jgi:hypothetical protein
LHNSSFMTSQGMSASEFHWNGIHCATRTPLNHSHPLEGPAADLSTA